MQANGNRRINVKRDDVMIRDEPAQAVPLIELSLLDPLIWPLVPEHARGAIAVLWRLDAHLGQMAVTGSEPVLRQIRLAWWRDQLADLNGAMTSPDPLLQDVATQLSGRLDPAKVADLAEAWSEQAIVESGNSTGKTGNRLFDLSAMLIASADPVPMMAGRGWALVRDALSCNAAASAAIWTDAQEMLSPIAINHLPRSLAVLVGLARRIAGRRGRRSRWREQAVIVRIGLLGR